MVIAYNLVQYHAQVHMVAIMIRQPHQLPVINLVTTRNQWKQSTKHGHQDLNNLIQLFVHLRVTYISHIPYPWSFANNSEHKSKSYGYPIQKYQYNAKISQAIIQSHLTQLVKLREYETLLGQYEVNILNQPIYFDLIYHFACQLSLEIPFHTLSFVPSFHILIISNVSLMC